MLNDYRYFIENCDQQPSEVAYIYFIYALFSFLLFFPPGSYMVNWSPSLQTAVSDLVSLIFIYLFILYNPLYRFMF